MGALHRLTALALLALAIATPARAQTTYRLGRLGLPCDPSDNNPPCSAGVFNLYCDTSEAKWKKCENGTVSDLGGGTTQLFVGTNGDLAASQTAYANLGGMVDAREAAVQSPINSTSRVWDRLRCRASAAPGGSGITITLRKGACGALAPSTLTCTIPAGGTSCPGEPIVAPQSISAPGECVSFSFVHSGGGAAVEVSCSVEQAA